MKQLALILFVTLSIFSCKSKKEIDHSNVPHPLLLRIESSRDTFEFAYTNSELTKLSVIINGRINNFQTYSFDSKHEKLTLLPFDFNGDPISYNGKIPSKETYVYNGKKLISYGEEGDAQYALYEYDNKGQIVKTSLFEDMVKTEENTYEYDASGNLIYEVAYDIKQSTRTKRYDHFYEYDKKKNPYSTMFPSFSPTEIEMLSPNNVIKATFTPSGSSSEVNTFSYIYNEKEYPTSRITKGNGVQGEITKFYYQ